MGETKYDLKSDECKDDMLFILKQLHHKELLNEQEYDRAVEMVLKGDY